MIERHHLEIVVASSDLARSILTQAGEAMETASEAALAERWYSAYANLWDGVRKALSALLQAQGLRPTRTESHLAVEQEAVAQVTGSTEFCFARYRECAAREMTRDLVDACGKVLPHLTVFQR